MNFDNTTLAVAEMFVDMTDIFTDAVDIDGLQMLMTYCLDASGLKHGKVVLDAFGNGQNLEVTESALSEMSPLRSNDLAEKARFTLQPEFAINGTSTKIFCEYAFPLRVRGVSLGTIQLYGFGEPPLSEQSIAVMQSIADIAATTIDQSHRIQQAHILVSQLQGALDSRVIIEQAKGVIAEREKIDFAQAFHQIRLTARKEQRPVRSVAADIVARHHCALRMNNPLLSKSAV